MSKLVVIGGGISGLAAARTAVDQAREQELPLEVVVLEREAEVGGKALTLRDDGWMVEAGPTGFLDSEAEFSELVQRSGASPITASAAAERRYIFRAGRMREIKPHPLHFARSGILSPMGLLRLAAEPFIAAKRSQEDESIWDFARRRLGSQAADRLIAPMVLGVFAGDAKKLSLRSAFPKIHALETEHGSLIRGMIHKMRSGRGSDGGPAGPGGKLTSFADGLQGLPKKLAATDDFEVRCRSEAQAVRRLEDGTWQVDLKGGAPPVQADAVVLAGEGWASAQLVRDLSPGLARDLDGIHCPAVVVVALGFAGPAVQRVPRSFGTLIPRGESCRILGCLFDTHLFPGRSAEGTVLVRAMLGGSVDPDVADLEDEEILTLVAADLRQLLGMVERPVYHRIQRWAKAIPQYEIGHGERVTRIETALAAQPGLFLAGNVLHGVAFSRAAVHGLHQGAAAVKYLSGVRSMRPQTPK